MRRQEISSLANRRIARGAVIVMGGFAMSNLIGLIRQVLVSRTFGTQVEFDSFSAAVTYPDLIFSLIAGGAMASAFIPTLTGFLAKKDTEGGWRLSSAMINIVFISLALLSLLSILFAPLIVSKFLTPSYSPTLQNLTVALLRILLIAPAIFGVSGLFMGILNSHQIFFWSAIAPSMLWLGMIFGVLFLAPQMGIFGLAWGYVIGAILHFFIQLPAILRLPARRYFWTFGLRTAAVREVFRLILPRLLGVAAVQVNFVVNTILATGMAVGSLGAIKYGWAIMTMPQVVISQSIAIAALPTFSSQIARGEPGEMRNSLAATLRGIILLSIPATVGMILLRFPVITMLFQRGAFTQESTNLVAWALLWYSLGLFGHGIVEILSRAFYAMHDTLTPVLVGVGAMSLNVVFSLAFTRLFTELNWLPFGGLALANTMATTLEMGILWILMGKRLDGLEGRKVLDSLIKASVASFIMGIGLYVWLSASRNQSVWIVGLGGIFIGVLVYGSSLMLLKIPEIALFKSILLKKIGRRKKLPD